MDCAISKASRFLPRARDKFARSVERHFFGSVIGLTKFVCKGLDEVRARSHENAWRVIFYGDCDERGPPGMHAKTNRCLLHCVFSAGESPELLANAPPFATKGVKYSLNGESTQ